MNICFLDCFSGISGDMLLGAFLDVGWEEKELLELPRILGLTDTRVSVRRVQRGGLSAIKVDVIPGNNDRSCRNIKQIKDLIDRSSLQQGIKNRVITAFERLAEVEAKVHGIGTGDVHFHETGAVDAIIDVTGAFVAKRSLKIDLVTCSPLPLSRNFTKCGHGIIPLPAPAVVELLKGKEIYFVREEKELVTPTGALLATELSDSWSELPKMKILHTGYGAGTWELRSRPNLLRIILGERDTLDALSDEVAELCTVVDDMNPEHIGYFMESVLDKGALDAWICPVFMKKNRPGFEIHVLSRPEDASLISGFFLSNTTTIGVRIKRTARIVLRRKLVHIKTKWGNVAAKIITRPNGNDIVPEFDQCKMISEKFEVPIAQVYEEVIVCGRQHPKRSNRKD